jgi:hypothetical protein
MKPVHRKELLTTALSATLVGAMLALIAFFPAVNSASSTAAGVDSLAAPSALPLTRESR